MRKHTDKKYVLSIDEIFKIVDEILYEEDFWNYDNVYVDGGYGPQEFVATDAEVKRFIKKLIEKDNDTSL